jgi:hypothetical protein
VQKEMKKDINGMPMEEAPARGRKDSPCGKDDPLSAVFPQEIRSAFEQIAAVLRYHDTDGTAQLKRFLWSLWNSSHQVNLYDLGCVLDSENSRAVATIFMAYMLCMLREEHLRWLLEQSGELRRWEQESTWNNKHSPERPVDYPPTPAHVRRHCLALGPLPDGACKMDI